MEATGAAPPIRPAEDTIDVCELCCGQFDDPVCTLTFTADDTGVETPMRLCSVCLRPVVRAMNEQYKSAVDVGNAAVDTMKRIFGIRTPPEASDG